MQLERLSTCLPGQSEDHAGALLLDEEGGAAPAGRGGIQKQFAIKGVAVYWQPGNSGSSEALPEAQAPSEAGSASLAAAPLPPPLEYVLNPTNCSIHSTLQLSAPTTAASEGGSSSGGLRVRAAAVVHHLRLSLDGQQAADMLALSDRLAWCTTRNKSAPYCPAGWRQLAGRSLT